MAETAKIRVFMDTNVWFSGLYSDRGSPSKILQLFLEGQITGLMSQQVLDELVRTFQQKLPQALPQLRLLLSNSQIEIVRDPDLSDITPLKDILDFEDAVILAAAISARADYFVTGDNHFLKNATLNTCSRPRIQSPVVFLKNVV